MAGSKGKAPHSGAHAGARIDITKKNKLRRAKKRARLALNPKVALRSEARKAKFEARRLAKLAKKTKKPEPVVVEAVVAPAS
jgi:hypothetical protein